MPRRTGHALSPRYAFDARSGRYHNVRSGEFVKQATIVRALEYQVTKSRGAMEAATERLAADTLTLKDWRGEMVKQIRTIHTAQYALGKGGWAKLDAADYGRIGGVIKEQLRYLNGFVKDLQAELFQGKLSGRAKVRAGMYADAARATYQQSRRRQKYDAGMRHERRILGAADHCAGCLAAAQLGWQPIWTLPPVGSTECTVQCQCQMIYKK